MYTVKTKNGMLSLFNQSIKLYLYIAHFITGGNTMHFTKGKKWGRWGDREHFFSRGKQKN